MPYSWSWEYFPWILQKWHCQYNIVCALITGFEILKCLVHQFHNESQINSQYIIKCGPKFHVCRVTIRCNITHHTNKKGEIANIRQSSYTNKSSDSFLDWLMYSSSSRSKSSAFTDGLAPPRPRLKQSYIREKTIAAKHWIYYILVTLCCYVHITLIRRLIHVWGTFR